MTHPILAPAVERHLIHTAVCRARRAGLLCSTCSELAERAARLGRGPANIGSADISSVGLLEAA